MGLCVFSFSAHDLLITYQHHSTLQQLHTVQLAMVEGCQCAGTSIYASPFSSHDLLVTYEHGNTPQHHAITFYDGSKGQCMGIYMLFQQPRAFDHLQTPQHIAAHCSTLQHITICDGKGGQCTEFYVCSVNSHSLLIIHACISHVTRMNVGHVTQGRPRFRKHSKGCFKWAALSKAFSRRWYMCLHMCVCV